MPYKNRYQKCGKISERKFREILRYFALDLTASDTARLTGISVRSINNIYIKIRYLLANECEKQTPFSGVIELDESYFGPKRIRGKRGRGAKGKTIVFGILKRDDKVYTEIVSDASSASLSRVVRGHVSIDSIINTDGWRGYNGLVDVGFEKHYRVHHGENEFAKGHQHINGIESFWSFAKARLMKFKGVPKHTFYYHLKETEFRFNHRHNDLYKILLKLLRNDPI
ncbi:IS1595-like element ISHyma1 family transposase [Hydrogenovibrio marinus]|uniref:Transposase n=1 Tax=Hydrogenovibrio marinus TaxID=28885 RepID=A0A066ZQ22_HYDMR|nr:IS1595-like element ISHyma1 family transposase [Hydrogenovibrio marinus]KDN95918.1 transposase [Hydrogenovibrio marinus]BBN58590.1 DDE transposase [Hydrogenovibrio marinus]